LISAKAAVARYGPQPLASAPITAAVGGILGIVSTSPTPALQQVGILVLDDQCSRGECGQADSGLRGMGRVRIVPRHPHVVGRAEKPGKWSLVIADVALTGPSIVLPSSPCAEACQRLRPPMVVASASCFSYRKQPAANTFSNWKPRVSPTCFVPTIFTIFSKKSATCSSKSKPSRVHPPGPSRVSALCAKRRNWPRGPIPCSPRATLFSYTDEELAEYEKQENEASNSRRKPRTNLGDPNR